MADQLEFKLEGAPEYTLLKVSLPEGTSLDAEAASLVAMSPELKISARFTGGVSRWFASQSLVRQRFYAHGGPGQLQLAPPLWGDIGHHYCQEGQSFFITAAAYLASAVGLGLKTKFQGLKKGLFSGESFFIIECCGRGDVWFQGFGGLFCIEVDGSYIVDTGHVVAFSEGLSYKVTKVGGYKSLLFSGEGFVCRFEGRGRLWLQSRSVKAYLAWAHSLRRQRRAMRST